MGLYAKNGKGFPQNCYEAEQVATAIARMLVNEHCTLAMADSILALARKYLEDRAVLCHPPVSLANMDQAKRDEYIKGYLDDHQ